MLSKIYSRIDACLGTDCDLLQNKIGVGVLYANKYIKTGDNMYFDSLKTIIGSIIEVRYYRESNLINGAAGVLWLLKYLKKLQILSFSSNQLQPITTSSRKALCKSLLYNNWDYYHGAIGHSLAIDDPKMYLILLDYFIRNIKKDSNGKYALLSLQYDTSTNLGLHAGILGVLSITNRLIKKDIYTSKAYEVQKKIIDIIFNKLISLNYGYYPALQANNFKSRMCFTYGELTLALHLMESSIITNNSGLRFDSTSIAQKACLRNSLDDTLIQDSCLICGSAGNYLLYKLLNKYYGNLFYEYEKLWLELTEDILIHNDFFNINRYTSEKVIDLSIMGGLSGIALSLDDFDQTWYESILINNVD